MRGMRSIGRSVAGVGLAATIAVTAPGVVAVGGQAPQQQQQQQPPPPQNPPAQNPQQPPTFRTRIDSISVDVIVTDRQGNPVP